MIAYVIGFIVLGALVLYMACPDCNATSGMFDRKLYGQEDFGTSPGTLIQLQTSRPYYNIPYDHFNHNVVDRPYFNEFVGVNSYYYGLYPRYRVGTPYMQHPWRKYHYSEGWSVGGDFEGNYNNPKNLATMMARPGLWQRLKNWFAF